MKLAGIVILYNPPREVFSNITTYIDFIDHLYVFDNSSISNNCIPEIYHHKSSYIHSGENNGIAKCLNQAISLAKNAECDFLLTMDQDSSFNENDLNLYINLVKNEINQEFISMFGIRYYAKNPGIDNKTYYNQLLITSGSIVNLKIAISISGFDENLFIDGVDTEFCLKSFKNGYKTAFYPQICLQHMLGEEKYITTPFLKKATRKLHNPIRLYYIVRNHLYLRKKYRNLRFNLKPSDILNEVKNCLLYGGKPVKYIGAILMAIRDVNRCQLGKLKNKYATKLTNRI